MFPIKDTRVATRVDEYTYTRRKLVDDLGDETPLATNPYRPTVGATPSDDTPLIIKGGEEFPSAQRALGQVTEAAGTRQWRRRTCIDRLWYARASRPPLLRL